MSHIKRRIKGLLVFNLFDPNKIIDLYIPKKQWKELVTELGTNKITVCLRMERERDE